MILIQLLTNVALITKEWGDGKTMTFSPLTKPRWTTQMNYHNMHQPFDIFCFVFVRHNELHEM